MSDSQTRELNQDRIEDIRNSIKRSIKEVQSKISYENSHRKHKLRQKTCTEPKQNLKSDSYLEYRSRFLTNRSNILYEPSIHSSKSKKNQKVFKKNFDQKNLLLKEKTIKRSAKIDT